MEVRCLVATVNHPSSQDTMATTDGSIGGAHNTLPSVARRSKMSLMKLFMMFIALLLMPVSECTCFNTLKMYRDHVRVAFLLPFLAPLARGAFTTLALFPLPPDLPPALPPALAGIVLQQTQKGRAGE